MCLLSSCNLSYVDYNKNAFWIPELIYDPSLYLSPHIFLLAVFFWCRAFRVDGLNDNTCILMDLKVHRIETLFLQSVSTSDSDRSHPGTGKTEDDTTSIAQEYA